MFNLTPEKIKKIPFAAIGILFAVVLSLVLLCVNVMSNSQAKAASPIKVVFEGEYRIADGEWQPVIRGESISATCGDVALKGKFYLSFEGDPEFKMPINNSVPIAMYFNHIGCEISCGGESYVLDSENKAFGASSCGKQWLVYNYEGGDAEVNILLRNPHSFGNATAVDDFLGSMYVWSQYSFVNSFVAEGSLERVTGFAVIVISLALLGVAIFSTFLRLPQRGTLWFVGLLSLFAGSYFVVASPNFVLWNDLVAFNTIALQICIMLFALVASCFTREYLSGKTRIAGTAVTAASGICVVSAVIYALVTGVSIYDTGLVWAIVQSVVCLSLTVCCVAEICKAATGRRKGRLKRILFPAVCALVHISLLTDIICTWLGVWQGGMVTEWVFGIVFVVALAVAFKIIPDNFRSSIREKEMYAELQEKRIALTRSQIQPHFLYNTLSSIAELCVIDPEKAQDATLEFTEYLRCNLNALDNPTPVPFGAELEHVKNYLALEQMRFGEDLRVIYDVRATDFMLPPLTVQPLVENAVKHGLGMKEGGGTVTVTSYSDDENFYVVVSDDGEGFDVDKKPEGSHIGIENVRYRLVKMCGASLEINSVIGEGTVAKITVPKEEGLL
ncbi:MAG: sensor histidine kinase [Candidatus Coproplasma sp.]